MKLTLLTKKTFISVLLIGVIATSLMDIVGLLLHLAGYYKIDWHLLGRWFGHILQGDFIYKNIPQSAPISHEVLLGWTAHYLVGFIYSAAYYFLVTLNWKKKPPGYTALLFAWAMMVFPFFVLQPAMGIDGKNSLMTFLLHTAFGIGLWLGYLLLKSKD